MDQHGIMTPGTQLIATLLLLILIALARILGKSGGPPDKD